MVQLWFLISSFVRPPHSINYWMSASLPSANLFFTSEKRILIFLISLIQSFLWSQEWAPRLLLSDSDMSLRVSTIFHRSLFPLLIKMTFSFSSERPFLDKQNFSDNRIHLSVFAWAHVRIDACSDSWGYTVYLLFNFY